MDRAVLFICAAVMILAVIREVNAANCKSAADCSGHGTCPATTAPCSCTGGYTGDKCTTAPCTDGGKECGSHGTCNTKGSTVKCDCKDGYAGTLCTQKSGGNRVTFVAQLFLLPMIASLFM